MAIPYDTIGINYAALRKPDPRIAHVVRAALGDARTLLNVGAGAGGYEPTDMRVTALEPSLEMIRQRPPGLATVVQGYAEDLPFEDNSFDAAMASLTVHHWTDKTKGFAEMRRVTRGRIVVFTFDPEYLDCWLLDYLPELATLDDRQMPKLGDYQRWLGSVEITPVPVPHDCTDGFLFAYWRRPAAYLDPKVRTAMSPFSMIGDVSAQLDRLARDLDTGAWSERYGDLMTRDALDVGYRHGVREA